MEEILYRYNPWWEGEVTFEHLVERSGPLNLMQKHFYSPEIVFLTGLRRVGKTTLLKLFIRYLLRKEKIDPKHIFYVSLDDYALEKFSILELVERYRALHKIRFQEKIFLFFDEITYAKDAEQQLKNLYDHQTVKVYASSSSASLLRTKKPYLTGRHTTIEILPLDFQEYLAFKKIIVAKKDAPLLDRYFEDYLQTGGLPEYVLRGDREYLKELVDDILYKDIAGLHGIKKPYLLKEFFLLLMERAGKVFSINKVAHILRLSPDTVKRYLQMFADTYLIYLVPRCGITNERILAPKKIYAADLGVRTLFTGFRDKGSLFENYVYLKLKDKNPCYLYRDGIEIDFLTDDKTLLEIKYHQAMSAKQEKLFKHFPAKKRFCITSLHDLDALH